MIHNSFKKAFTLIEVMIVIGIVVILAAIGVVFRGSGNSQLALFTDQAKVVGVLTRAKSLALQKLKAGGTDNVCATGVYFSTSTAINFMVIFKDLDEDKNLDNGCSSNGQYDGDSSNEMVDRIDLDRSVAFASAPETILFIPPYLEASSSVPFPITIILHLVNNPVSQAKVEVGLGGAITSL